MPKYKILLLASAFFLILACNLPQPRAGPNPQNTDPEAIALQPPRVNLTLESPSPSGTPFKATSAIPPVPPTATMAFSTVDEFFERCPTSGEVAMLLADISIAFEVDPTRGTLACKKSEGSLDLSRLQKRAYLSILIMKAISFGTPLPWTDKDLYPWFIDTIDGIRFRADITNSFCCEPANVINIQVTANSYILQTGRWIDPAIAGGLMDQMVLYVHEARHNDGYGHTCNAGTDDKTVSEMGAWGVQYYLLQWLAQHVNPWFFRAPGGDPNVYRQIALNDMVMIRKSRFCNEPTVTPGAAPTLAE
ncbi:MAG: hypothetical protein A3K46_06285 [Chloroflexi bacterium RBG_13_60_9]|nr:MAG: hypothetical protein A3K46_06285 [Chloroflexi bacterium RBG_13_60_9]